MRRLFRALAMGVSALVVSATAQAQTAENQRTREPEYPRTRLVITVSDPSGGVIPGATVTVVPQDEAAKARASTIPPVLTSSAGLATIEGLAPGRYIITAEFSGFEAVVLKDYRVRAGD